MRLRRLGHNEIQDAYTDTDRRDDHPGAHPAQPFFFGRLEKFFDLGQDIFRDFLEIFRILNLANLVRHSATNLFAGGDGRGGYGVRPLQTHAHRAEISSTGTAVLAGLSFFGSAAGTKHDRCLIRKKCADSSKKLVWVAANLKVSRWLGQFDAGASLCTGHEHSNELPPTWLGLADARQVSDLPGPRFF